MGRKLETEQDLIRALAELFEQDDLSESMDEVDDELRSAGLEPADVGSRLAAIVEKAYRTAPANWRQRASRQRRAAEERLNQRPGGKTSSDRDEIVRRIREVVSHSPKIGEAPRVQAHFRNFEIASDEDLANLLEELEFLATEEPEDA